MPDQHQRLIRLVSQLATINGQTVRMGTVHEVKPDKVRMVLGKDHQGKDVIGPWTPTGTAMYGGARERRFFKKGQNLLVVMVNSDPSQAALLPYAPNKNFPPPDHANNTGQDEEVYQLEDLRVRKTKNGYEIWLQSPTRNQQTAEGRNANDDRSGQARMKIKIDNNGGVTGRVGKNRFAAHSKGAKIKAGNDYLVVTPGKIISSREIVIDGDPIPDDDA